MDAMEPLATHPCRALCSWSVTDQYRNTQRLFRCNGCTSEWVSSEPWTPIDADGTIPGDVIAERSRDRTTSH
jgi:hypothetical protein